MGSKKPSPLSVFLITDAIALTNIGSTLFNAGFVPIMGMGLAKLIRARFNGYLLSGIFTLLGFAFFEKNPFNIHLSSLTLNFPINRCGI